MLHLYTFSRIPGIVNLLNKATHSFWIAMHGSSKSLDAGSTVSCLYLV